MFLKEQWTLLYIIYYYYYYYRNHNSSIHYTCLIRVHIYFIVHLHYTLKKTLPPHNQKIRKGAALRFRLLSIVDIVIVPTKP